jgi:flagellar basal-body rod modification protein FlgD
MITATSSSTNSTATSSSSTNTTGTDAASQQDRFMKLLVAQLNNQDPMNPMDNAQMTSQIAQINTVSGIEQLNTTMKSMAAQFNAMQMLQTSSLVGRDVYLEGNTLAAANGTAKGAVDLLTKADSVKIQVKTPGGQLLDTIDMGAKAAGRHEFTWDASKYTGTSKPVFTVVATQAGKAVSSTSLVRDTVSAIGTANGVLSIELKGRSAVAYSDIKAIL